MFCSFLLGEDLCNITKQSIGNNQIRVFWVWGKVKEAYQVQDILISEYMVLF